MFQTFSKSSHELQSSRGAEVDAGPFQLIVVQERACGGGVRALRDVAHLHWPAGQLKAVQLLQGLFCTLGICKLEDESR